jgi:hypothetical protein
MHTLIPGQQQNNKITYIMTTHFFRHTLVTVLHTVMSCVKVKVMYDRLGASYL